MIFFFQSVSHFQNIDFFLYKMFIKGISHDDYMIVGQSTFDEFWTFLILEPT